MLTYSIRLLLLLLGAVVIIDCTLSPSKSKDKDKSKKDYKLNKGPLDQDIFARNLIQELPTAKNILIENQGYYKNTATKRFNGTLLGYVTPWNGHGYDVARTWANKFSSVSPVWLQLKRQSHRKFVLNGKHDIDAEWVKSVRESGAQNNVQILPRVLFENWSAADIKALNDKREIQTLASFLSDSSINDGFNGYVLEIWSQFLGRLDTQKLIEFITAICSQLHSTGQHCILVVPPWHGTNNPELFSREHFEALYPHVTAFSLMTYDFSNPQRPGPNAPAPWVEQCVLFLVPDATETEKRASILVGMNLYGNAYSPQGGGAILGPQYIDLLGHYKGKLKYDAESKEQFFDVKTPDGRFVVFYPTLHSINARLELAMKLGTGVALWELGQGLDYFFDLF